MVLFKQKTNSRVSLPEIAAFFCAVLMLACVPLVFRNALFDINRVKVDVVCAVVPLLVVLFLIASVIAGQAPQLCRSLRLPASALLLFLVSCVISSGRQGFEPAVLWGSEGRYCGLVFLVCCICAFFVIAFGAMSGVSVRLISVFAAAAVAFLGVLNALGIDPFGFYTRMLRGQVFLFLSTIGNIDFFGCYLATMLPVAAGMSVFSERLLHRLSGLACSVLILLGITVSRSDSALAALQIAFLTLTVLSGNSFARMSAVLMLWGFSFASIPLLQPLLLNGSFKISYTGLYLALCSDRIAWRLAAILFSGSLFCLWMHRRSFPSPGRKRIGFVSLAALLLILLALLGYIFYFTVIAPDFLLGEFSSFLRFDDQWGTRRGFVYRRSFRALADYELLDCLFGKGLEMTNRILKPYFDQPEMLRYGTFNDAHCQPLQFLLTTGILGAVSLIIFHLSLLRICLRYSRNDDVMCGYVAALCAYVPVALINVTQPILIVVYLSVAALAASRIQYETRKEGPP